MLRSTPRGPHAARAGALAIVCLAAVLVPAGTRLERADAQEAAGRAPVAYRRPVGGPVVRGFDPGSGPYGPGHRGVDLAAGATERVRAAAGGKVAFVGGVAGTRWVSIDHPDGVRTSYGPMGTIDVVRGQAVSPGATLGSLAPGHDRSSERLVLHWGARRAGAYLDPMTLLTGSPRPWRATLVGPGAWEPTDLPDVPRYEPWDGEHRLGTVPGSPIARGPGWSTAPNPNHVVTVAGFTSTSRGPAFDATHLGYDVRSVTHLSHRGRRHDVDGVPDRPNGDQQPYEAWDTLVGIDRLADRLDAQLRAQHQRSPGQAVDLVGHSMGGVVIVHYLLTRYDPADPALPPIDHVVTLASPLEGADTASAGLGLNASRALSLGLHLLGRHEAVTSASARDLAVGSELLAALADAWQRTQDDIWSSPLANGTDLLTVGAQFDQVVSQHRSDLPGAEHVVLPGGHDRVRETEASRQVVRAFLANQPVPGEDGGVGHWIAHDQGTLVRLLGQGAGFVTDDLLLGRLTGAGGLWRWVRDPW